MPRQTERSEWGFPNRATPLGSPAYYALRFSPAANLERDARLLAWYGLVREIAAQPRDPGVARLKLDWWRSELEHLAAGSPRHPLSKELLAHGLSADALPTMHSILEGAEWPLCSPRPGDEGDLIERCRNAEGLLFLLFGNGEAEVRETGLRAGAFCGMVEALRFASVQAATLPEALDPARLMRLDRTKRVRLIEAVLERTDAPDEDNALPAPARRLLAMAHAMRNKLRRRGYPCTGPVVDRPPIAHLWTAWRCR
jgi:15-cis-phytoene synthase